MVPGQYDSSADVLKASDGGVEGSEREWFQVSTTVVQMSSRLVTGSEREGSGVLAQ